MESWRSNLLRASIEIVGGLAIVAAGMWVSYFITRTFSFDEPNHAIHFYYGASGLTLVGIPLFVRGMVRLVPFDHAGASARPLGEGGLIGWLTSVRVRYVSRTFLVVALAVRVIMLLTIDSAGPAAVAGSAVAALAIVFVLLSGAPGYKSFVAWRYLLNNPQRVTFRVKLIVLAGLVVRFLMWLVFDVGLAPPDWTRPADVIAVLATAVALLGIVFGIVRYSKPAFVTFWTGIVLGLGCLIDIVVLNKYALGLAFSSPDELMLLGQILTFTALGGFVLAAIALFFGVVRAFFTFFTTVPVGGVWLGTMALVIVLSVMSGFETDLRDKILGSNAHLQITREDGDFAEWHAIKKRIDATPGVVASTPYAVSEVVIAANNNGMPVLIKGIDPKTVGTVTELEKDLEDRTAMSRLDPIITDNHDLVVPQHANTPGVDPPPPDMPSPGDPIDFSVGSASGSAAGSGSGSGSAGAVEGPPVLPHVVIDPPPADLVTSDEAPADYSRSDYAPDSAIKITDDAPAVSRRTQSLPGILVGRELVKQTHLYTGEEVRVVSPLSDPSNPDATGTPIPFNRDYRVAGIFYTGMYEYDLKYVYVTLDSLQEFLDRGDAVDGIEVRVDNPDDTDYYVAMFQNTLGPQYRVQDWKELNHSLFSALKLEKIAMFLVLGIVILVASFSIINNLIMVVVEKGREIALLKTLGASDAGVMQLFAIQGLMIGVIGTLLGCASGLWLCYVGKKYGLPLNPDVYYIDRLPIHVDWPSVLAAAGAGIFISIAATLYPAFLAAHVRPATGMRH